MGLAMMAGFIFDETAHKAHVVGFQQMVRLRGGIDAFASNTKLQIKIGRSVKVLRVIMLCYMDVIVRVWQSIWFRTGPLTQSFIFDLSYSLSTGNHGSSTSNLYPGTLYRQSQTPMSPNWSSLSRASPPPTAIWSASRPGSTANRHCATSSTRVSFAHYNTGCCTYKTACTPL
jgi:hypothetical protein